MATKTIIEQLSELLDADGKSKLQSVLAANPKLAVDDRRMGELFGIYMGAESDVTGATDANADAAAAAAASGTHTASLPSAASTTAAAVTTASTVSSTNDSAAVLAALNSLKSSIDDRFKNVVTMDKVNELGAGLINQAATQALRQADEIFTIRDTHQREFGEPFDRALFEKFITDNQDATTKRNKYSTLTDAYNAMVSDKRVKAEIAKGVADGVKQKLSSATVPGQTTSAGLSAAQQINAKAKKDSAAAGGSQLQSLIAKAEALDRAKQDAGAVN
jgi:hypothetical protein